LPKPNYKRILLLFEKAEYTNKFKLNEICIFQITGTAELENGHILKANQS